MKFDIFEYFIFKSLIHLQTNGKDNDLSILKCVKLCFFFSTVEDEEGDSLLETFNDIYAMPLGHVEASIYSAMKNDNYRFFSFDRVKTSLKVDRLSFDNFDQEIKIIVDRKFQILLTKNPNLLFMSAYDLVELSHQWFSWRYFYSEAKKNSLLKMKIPTEVVKTENKIYLF
ncbi:MULTISPECIES: hypothetical protein [unclassified Sphingobacterium]|uniref:hypothetical protein n=1 Tax=unclassified Sphingobacterium TaxID=2609468 RepID=UPI00104CE69A|nr:MULTISPECIES: hypothetical protein [unclassified Sphingobacterium]MCS3556621.1 putative phage-associated protein [Sphingobacterium sp. JUb21]TCQ99913.1 hypothetical protein EDF66_113138 [Sphingobacterium sp. JUb20]